MLLNLPAYLLVKIAGKHVKTCQHLWLYLRPIMAWAFEFGSSRENVTLKWIQPLVDVRAHEDHKWGLKSSTSLFGRLHSLGDFPAISTYTLSEWRFDGQLHRDRGPAIERVQMIVFWQGRDLHLTEDFPPAGTRACGQGRVRIWVDHGKLSGEFVECGSARIGFRGGAVLTNRSNGYVIARAR